MHLQSDDRAHASFNSWMHWRGTSTSISRLIIGQTWPIYIKYICHCPIKHRWCHLYSVARGSWLHSVALFISICELSFRILTAGCSVVMSLCYLTPASLAGGPLVGLRASFGGQTEAVVLKDLIGAPYMLSAGIRLRCCAVRYPVFKLKQVADS